MAITSPSMPQTSETWVTRRPPSRCTGDLDDQIDRADDLGADGLGRQAHVAHLNHIFDAGQCVAGVVGMDRRHAAVVAGVHRLQHVESLAAADFTDDDAIGAHPQGVANEFALIDFALALQAVGPGFQPDDVRLLQL